jgi:hypothetical protein
VNGELAQLVALVAHGNAALAGAPVDAPALERTNTTFRFVRSLAFLVVDPWGRELVADSVAAWLDAIAPFVGRLSLCGGEGSGPSAFVNTGGWWMAGHERGGSATSAWRGEWTVNRDGVDPADPQPRIWQIAYGSRRMGPFAPPAVDLDGRAASLRRAIASARAFALREPVLAQFVPWFDEAVSLGSDPAAVPTWHPEMLPAVGYPAAARQLLAMASRAWVFGGMGSWNDVGFGDPATADEYRRVSDRLYGTCVDAIRDAANAFTTTVPTA